MQSQVIPAPVAASSAMCAHAFDVLCDELGMHRSAKHAASESSVPDADGVGVFVTWNEPSPPNAASPWQLRGCIGTLSPTALRPALRYYATYSALQDSRFEPVSAAELPRLQVVVSVLSGFEVAPRGVYDWTIGVHGIVLEVRAGPRGERAYSATYLPEVCEEQGWSKEECIKSLAKKAGFRGKLTPAILQASELTRYVSTKASMLYPEYVAQRSNGRSSS